jgi:hypothetical protein
MGLKSETQGALGNASQSTIAEEIVGQWSLCCVLWLEWSIWDRTGIGHRRGSLYALARFGVDAVELEQGLVAFERLTPEGATGSRIVTSPLGPPSCVALAHDAPVMRSSADELLLFYPGLEAVVRMTLAGADGRQRVRRRAERHERRSQVSCPAERSHHA